MYLRPSFLLLALFATSVLTQHDGMMHGMHGMGAMDNAKDCGPLDICVTEPKRDNCTLPFKLPHTCAVADATKLCKAMHFMTACSVAKKCNASGADWAKNANAEGKLKVSRNNPNICRPFQHVVTVCKLDTGMSKMAGCKHFSSMCVEGSKVDMCSNVTGLTELPTTAVVNDQVRSICEAKDMPRCKECTANWKAGKKWADCDLLDVYGSLCDKAPDMKQCSAWHTMCKADPTLWVCHGYSKAAQAAAPPQAVVTESGPKAKSSAATAASAQAAAPFVIMTTLLAAMLV